MIPQRSWPRFLADFPGRYPSASAFHARSHRRWGEPRRACDRAARTPFAPNNWRLYRQTYAGLASVLLPLVRCGVARVLPFQAPRPGMPWLLECCPASALKRLGAYRPYKGAGAALARQRMEILRVLERDAGVERVAPQVRRRIVSQAGGDALDSVLAAWIAWRALRHPRGLQPRHPGWPPIEGWVWF